jgi:hypothetical protein
MGDANGPGSNRVSRDVIRKTADALGESPGTLEPPLYEAVDVEALDALYESGSQVRIQFEYAGRTVSVHPDGSVTVSEVTRGRHAVEE